jgi:presequence protease
MMMSMCDSFKIGDTYRQFDVISVFEVPDYHSTAIHLRHRVTGLEVFHMLNDEQENLFSFTFRTPCPDSSGIPHILEHSVLCGSERYPVKDPFIRLANQSVKTYLNAMTYPDRTIFPASSTVRADYFNLMSVYGDAVFFPLLNQEIFFQEAHRLELDDEGKPSIQGVVYNEMKGNYSSFESVAADEAVRSLFSGCVYEKDSGGDPLEIPSLTHEQLVAFHAEYYQPGNCFVFLYGNIPTTVQLDFLQDQFLDRLEIKYPPVLSGTEAAAQSVASCLTLVTPDPVSGPVVVHADGPTGDETESGNTVLVSWRLGRAPDAARALEYLVLAGILVNHDGSPLQQALLESGLGEDIAPQTMLDGSLFETLFTVGLRGVKPENCEKVQTLILDTLHDIVETGINEDDITAILMSLEFNQREIRRSRGPYALSLMNGPIYGWQYGWGPENGLRLRSTLDVIRHHILTDAGYLQNLIKTLLIDNPARSLVIVTPSPSYTINRENSEKKLIESFVSKVPHDDVLAQLNRLHCFQKKDENGDCIPHLSPADFLSSGNLLTEHIATDILTVPGCDGSMIPFFTNKEYTNGIVYFDIGFPVDILTPAQYELLPLLSETVTECGWGDASWDVAARRKALLTGGFSASLIASETPETALSQNFVRQHPWCGREWLIFRISMLEENSAAAVDLLADCIAGTRFHDLRRLHDIVQEYRNDLDASVIPSGNDYVLMRVSRRQSRAKAIDEIWNGLSSLFTVHRLSGVDTAQLAHDFTGLFDSIRNAGCFIHLTADDTGISKIHEVLPALIKKISLHAPKQALNTPLSDFIALTELPGSSNSSDDTEYFSVPAQIGFAAECCTSSPFGSREAAAEEVCAHWLSNTLLWERLRTIGGAYSAHFSIDSIACSGVFSSYRDPTPLLSADVFESAVRESALKSITSPECVRSVIGTYSSNIQPRSPYARGATGLLRTLYAIQDDDREQKVRRILSITPEDMHQALVRFDQNLMGKKYRAVICAKFNETDGKFVTLPL